MAMARVPRAVGRMVVWVDAVADTAMTSSRTNAITGPSMGPPRTVTTSSMLASLFRPIPVVPNPAYACTATATRQ
jgi:hypothetical protein